MSEDTPATEEREFNPAKLVGKYREAAYLDVAHRLLWLDHEHPKYSITTELLHYSADLAVVKATVVIYDEQQGCTRTTVAHAQAIPARMPPHIANRWLEKAETAAVGRALGMLGLGTLHAQEFDDTEHLADSPVGNGNSPNMETRWPGGSRGPATRPPDDGSYGCEMCGEELQTIRFRDGTEWSPAQLASLGRKKHGHVLCMNHYREANAAKRGGNDPANQ